MQYFPLPNVAVGTAAYNPLNNWIGTNGSRSNDKRFDIKIDQPPQRQELAGRPPLPRLEHQRRRQLLRQHRRPVHAGAEPRPPVLGCPQLQPHLQPHPGAERHAGLRPQLQLHRRRRAGFQRLQPRHHARPAAVHPHLRLPRHPQHHARQRISGGEQPGAGFADLLHPAIPARYLGPVRQPGQDPRPARIQVRLGGPHAQNQLPAGRLSGRAVQLHALPALRRVRPATPAATRWHRS